MRTTSITVPKPCHQNWENMTQADRGKFCQSCQKIVYDFTQSSDRQIASVLQSEKNACGRFLQTQLNRDLIVPKQKSTIWTAAVTGMLALINFGNDKIYAQQKPDVVQAGSSGTQAKMGEVSRINSWIVCGKVTDESGTPFPGITVTNKSNLMKVQTDFDGNFEIQVFENGVLSFNYPGYRTTEMATKNQSQDLIVKLSPEATPIESIFAMGTGVIVGKPAPRTNAIEKNSTQNRTFFGRIFHTIAKIFQ